MIFMDKETGELFEFLITSLGDDGFDSPKGHAYPVGGFAVKCQPDSKMREILHSEFAENYDFIGFL